MKMYKDLPAKFTHPAHPASKLKLVSPDPDGGAPFLCDGCKEPGYGPRYTCTCPGGSHSFDLHTCCALAEDTLLHPLFGNNNLTFKFLREPTPPVEETICNACGDPARGFVYHCAEKDLDLHPCCATLKPFDNDGHTFELQSKKVSRCAVCGENRRRRRFWVYRSMSKYDGKTINMHVACVKEMARRRWEVAYQNRIGGGGGIVPASGPIMEGVLRNLPRQTKGISGFHNFIRMAQAIAQVIIAVIFGNPVALIGALVGPGGFLRDWQ